MRNLRLPYTGKVLRGSPPPPPPVATPLVTSYTMHEIGHILTQDATGGACMCSFIIEKREKEF